jgi:hypothetical protein
MREPAAHSEDALLENVRDVVGCGAVKQKSRRCSDSGRSGKLNAVPVDGANSAVAEFKSIHAKDSCFDKRFIDEGPIVALEANRDDQVLEARPAFFVEVQAEMRGIMAQGKRHRADEAPLIEAGVHGDVLSERSVGRLVPVPGDDWTKIVGESVESVHRFLAISTEKQCLNRLSLYVVDDGPKAESPNPASHGLAYERQRVVSFRLEYGETLLGCNTDVGFQHDPSIAQILGAIQLPNTCQGFWRWR